MVVVYRDLHCSLCKAYLAQLKLIYAEFRATGVYVFIVLGDPKAKAQLMADATALILPTGYGLSVVQMQAFGLYVSDLRTCTKRTSPFLSRAFS